MRSILSACALVAWACAAPAPVAAPCDVNHGGCSIHAFCDDSSGSAKCTCSHGYAGDGVNCETADLCAEGNGGCDAHAKCTNREGTRSCACLDGYTGDGFTCTAVEGNPGDPCVTGNGGCDPHATCTNHAGVAECTCKPGFTGNGTSCAPVPPANPCLTNNGGCDAHATCTNNAGVAGCTCNAGYSGNGTTCSANPTCTPVTARPDVDAWGVRAPGIGFGRIFEQPTGSHSDVFLDNPSGRLRLGVRRDWGGTVVFWGLAADPASNTIDANDTGRELQLALYDPARAMQGCAFNASCVQTPSTCGGGITYLGWDPVQGGDECVHGAQVLSAGRVGDALEVVVQPVQWNPDWNRPDCVQSACSAAVPVNVTYKLDFRFVREHVVEVAMEVSSQESFSHDPTDQEFPTLYVGNGANGTSDFPLLLDAAGNPITLSNEVSSGLFVGEYVSPRPWTTWQHAARDYGVALASDAGLTGFQGWRGDGHGSPYFHNVRGKAHFGLGAGRTVRGIAYLALGSFSTVQSELEAALAARPPFGYLDAPAANATATFNPGQPLTVAGWALDNAHLAAVSVLLDGREAASVPVNGARADVCEAYPNYDGCPNVGFSASIPTTGLDACAHLLKVVARDADGNETVIGERVVQAH